MLAALAKLYLWLFGSKNSPPKEPRGRCLLTAEVLEPRTVPSDSPLDWLLPAGGGDFRLSLQGDQLALTRGDGTVLEQTAAVNVTVNIHASGDAEAIHADFTSANSADSLKVNFPDLGDDDQVLINLSTGPEKVILAPRTVKVSTGHYALNIIGPSTIQVFGNGGNDTLTVYDGPGEDVLEARQDYMRMALPESYAIAAEGFKKAAIYANPAEANRASVAGSPGNDFAKMDGAQVSMLFDRTNSPDLRSKLTLFGFRKVFLDANFGGTDVLELRDSVFSDGLVFEPNHGTLSRGDGIMHSFQGFGIMRFFANSGMARDWDVVRLFDSPGMETFYAMGIFGIYLDGKNAWDLRIQGAEAVELDGSYGGRNILSRSAFNYRLTARGFRPASQYAFTYRLSRPWALYWIRRMALFLDPSLARAANKMDLAIRLRDFVNQRFRIGSNSTAWPTFDAYERFRQALITRQEAVLCQGLAWLYRDLLNAFDIQAREVSLFSANGVPNHASVEVFMNGRWFVMDPTYNVSFTDSIGNLLSYAQMRARGIWNIERQAMVSRRWLSGNNGLFSGFDATTPYRIYLFRIQYPPLYE